MYKRFTLFVLFLLCATFPVFCQSKNTSDYNYRKACEALFDEQDSEKAVSFLEKQLEDDPKHADSYYLRARISYSVNKYDSALRDINSALKYQGQKSIVVKSSLYALRASIYSEIDRDNDAIAEYLLAIRYARKDNKEYLQDLKFSLGQAYYNSDQIKEAEQVFLDMLKDDPNDAAAMVGLARNCQKEEKYKEGLEWLDKAEALDDTYSQVYRFKMSLLDKLGQTDEAIDAAIRYLELDDDAPLGTITEYVGKHYTYGIAKTKAMINKNPGEYCWPFLLSSLYMEHCDYKKAIEQYEVIEKEFGDYHLLSYLKAQCYNELGQYDNAIAAINKAIEQSGDNSYVGERGDIFRSAGRYEDAISDYQHMSDADPTVGYYYYAIGWCHELQGIKSAALEYYNQGIDIDKTYPYLFVSRGEIFKEQGKTDEANADFEKVLQLDDQPTDGSCRQYALVGLGRVDEAIEWMDSIIEKHPEDHGCYYDKACVCGRVGKIDEGIKALETAFEKGFRKFSHIENDDDMNPFRELPEFKSLIKKYKEIYLQELNTSDVNDSGNIKSVAQTEIRMKRISGGTYEVPCSINGLSLKFILDTGASDVTISSLEAGFMLKNDYLTEKDIKGKRNYLTASGEITEGTIICLKEVMVGDVTLKNINASVVKSQKAPLLLGQSVLERFGSITIDNDNSKLIIRH